MQKLHRAILIVLITGSLLATAAIAYPTLAGAAVPPDSVHPSVLGDLDPLRVTGPSAVEYEGVRAGPTDSARADSRGLGRWRPPVGTLDPDTRFDPPPLPWLPGHRGVDLGARPGREVRATGPGAVVFADELAGRGVVSIDHPGGLRTTYEPVDPLVEPGDAVTAGQIIGRLAPGHGSCSEGSCLHLGLKRGRAYLDPMLLFGAGQVRLLPRS